MRLVALLVGTSMLAACGGGGGSVGSAGSIPAPSGGPINAPEHTFVKPTLIKTYQGNGAMHRFQYQTHSSIVPERQTSGNIELINYAPGQFDQLYAGNATTVRNSSVSLTYNPRDAIFDLLVGPNPSSVSANIRFQDPAHRTDFGGTVEPQFGVPEFSVPGMRYLQVASGRTDANFRNGTFELATRAVPDRVEIPGTGTRAPGSTVDDPLTSRLLSQAAVDGAERRVGALATGTQLLTPTSVYDRTTLFYQLPGTTTQYVTFVGFLRNVVGAGRNVITRPILIPDVTSPTGTRVATNPDGSARTELVSVDTTHQYDFTRGAFVFGEQTVNSSVLRTGTGSFAGSMIGTAVLNDRIDDQSLVRPGVDDSPTYFQWLEGRSSVNVDFGANTFNIALDASVRAPIVDYGTSGIYSIQGGAVFGARGSGRIDLVAAGGFLGQFQQAWFINPNNSRLNVQIEGSSVDGAFYGPQAQEVGGSFRIVGGTPDERIDILGVFTASRPR